MPHYKAPDNSVHFLTAEAIAAGCEKYLPIGSAQITDAEAELQTAANAPKPTAEQMRAERTAKLSACDWTQTSDAPLTAAQKAAWAAYRQILRDLPTQVGFPASIAWPPAP